MSCEQSKTLIQLRLDGLLSQTERVRLDAHLEQCEACRFEWNAQRRLAHLTGRWAERSLAASDLGAAFTSQVLARLDTAQQPSCLGQWLPPAAVLLLLAVILLVPAHLLPGAESATEVMLLLHGLPLWLNTNLSALPADAADLLTRPRSPVSSAWIGILLVVMAALNSLFCVSARRRSVS